MDRTESPSGKFKRTKSLEIKRSHRSPSMMSHSSMGKPINMSMPANEDNIRSPSVVSYSSMGKPVNMCLSVPEDSMSALSGEISVGDSAVESMNTDLSGDARYFIPQNPGHNPRHAVPGDVECDLCEESKFKACKSCLTCLASFCEVHVIDHYKIKALRRHLLVEVTNKLSMLQENAQLKKTLAKEREENQILRDKNLSLKKVNETLKQMICELRLPDYICKEKLPVAAALTLDPNTAHCALLLSDDCKRVRVGDKTTVQQSTQRFDKWECVLSRESFKSGRHYWEVEVNREFTIGVTRHSAQRKGKFTFCPTEGYWCVYHFRQAFTALDDPTKRLQGDCVPRVLGICVDVDEKWVTFYNTETKAHIYTYSNMVFSDGEEIYPVFNTLEKADLEIKTGKIFTV